MAFDFKSWQSDVRAWWAEHSLRLRATPVEAAYTLVAASTLPVFD